jgi:hypothetical protein
VLGGGRVVAKHRADQPKWWGIRVEWYAFRINWPYYYKPKLKRYFAELWNDFKTKS